MTAQPSRAHRAISSAIAILTACASAVGSFLTEGMVWLLFFAFSGAAAVTTGIFLLYGIGFALISAGLFCMLFAWVIFRGI
jgi:hypothetical protein